MQEMKSLGGIRDPWMALCHWTVNLKSNLWQHNFIHTALFLLLGRFINFAWLCAHVIGLFPWCIGAVIFRFRIIITSLITRFMGPTWGQSGADRTQAGPVLAPWTLLSGIYTKITHEKNEGILIIIPPLGITLWWRLARNRKVDIMRYT